MVHNLSDNSSVLHQFLLEIRHSSIQKDAMRFRRNLERIAEVMAYELSKTFSYISSEVQTPLGVAQQQISKDKLVLATILRAGLPFHQGFLNYFDHSESAFVSAYRRKSSHAEGFEIDLGYFSSPSLSEKVLILSDPMLATGLSLVACCKALIEKYGTPTRIVLCAVLAAPEGVAYVRSQLPNAEIWVAQIDEKLSEKGYILPGLGDAGDLAYGDRI
jgi:uracil phosphoribosyltransferase